MSKPRAGLILGTVDLLVVEPVPLIQLQSRERTILRGSCASGSTMLIRAYERLNLVTRATNNMTRRSHKGSFDGTQSDESMEKRKYHSALGTGGYLVVFVK